MHVASTTTTNGIDEVLRKFVEASTKVSAASARHDLALQRANSAQKEHDNMKNMFTSYPAIAEQKQSHMEITQKEVRDAEDNLKFLEFALSKALKGIITTANDQKKPTESSSSLEQDRALRASYEIVVSELDETKSRCKRLEQQMEDLQRSTGKHDHDQKFIFEDLRSIRKEVSVVKGEASAAQENRRRIDQLQIKIEAQNKDLGRHDTKLVSHDRDIAALKKDGQGHTADLERQKAAVDKLRESPEQKTAQTKTSTALQKLSERLNDLEAKNTKSNMNIKNEFTKQDRRFDALSSTVAKKLDAPSTTANPVIQREIDAIKSTIQKLQENDAAITALGQRVSVVEDDALPSLEALGQRVLTIENVALPKSQALEARDSTAEMGASSKAQAMQHDIEAIKSTIQGLKEQEGTRNQQRSSTVETNPTVGIQSLEKRLSTLEVDVSPLRQEIEQRFEHLNEENIDKDNVYDQVIKEVEEHFEELRENSSCSIREIRENIGPIHAAIQDMQESIHPIHAAIEENRESFLPVHEAIRQMQESLTTVQEAVRQLEKRPLATPTIPSNATTNGHVSSPSADTASLDQQKLDTLGYAVGDLERRFSNIQTDELANQMVDQMKKLYPAPANLQQTIDNINKKFHSLASQTQQALEVRNGKLDTIGARADAASAKAEECTFNFAKLGHEVQESRTALRNLVAALPKGTNQSEEALLGVRNRVNNLETDLQKWASLIQGIDSRLNTVGLENLKTDHQALAGKVSGLKVEVARVGEETTRAVHGDIAMLEGALNTLMKACSEQEKQMATVHGVVDNISKFVGHDDPEWD